MPVPGQQPPAAGPAAPAAPPATALSAVALSAAASDGPSSAAEALAALDGALGYLVGAGPGSLTVAEQADVLRGLERAASRQTAVRAGVLAAFVSGGGLEADGQCSARGWLMWRGRVTRGAAAGAVAWMRRLAAHPLVRTALAGGEISESWARQVCDWSDLLPADRREDADRILLAAAAAGAALADLSALAEEIFRRCAPPDPDDDDDGFTDRSVQLDTHFRGAGKLTGELTPECNAALAAVLESLGKKAGPEDDRTQDQRYHDALEEMCRRLTAAGGLPDRAGQPTQVQLHLTLDQLRDLPGGQEAEAAWAAARGAGDGQPGWLASRAAAEAYACDAKITPIVSGHVDRAALDQLTAAFLGYQPSCGQIDPAALAAMTAGFLEATTPERGCACALAGCTGPCATADRAGSGPARPLGPQTWARLQDALLRYAAGILSGPAGLAAYLRTGLTGQHYPAVSLPLDVGAATDQVPPHLRRAVIARDRHCAFPGCSQPPSACQVHHIIPRSKGGATRLDNLLLLCAFHHLIAIHRWGWTITLHGDGTVTAVSPDKTKTLHSHGPPGQGPPRQGPPGQGPPGQGPPGQGPPGQGPPGQGPPGQGPPGQGPPGQGPPGQGPPGQGPPGQGPPGQDLLRRRPAAAAA